MRGRRSLRNPGVPALISLLCFGALLILQVSRADRASRSSDGALASKAGSVNAFPRPSNSASNSTEPGADALTKIGEVYGKLPLSFEANQGQIDSGVKFLTRGAGYGIFLTSAEAVLRLTGSHGDAEKGSNRPLPASTHRHIASLLRMKLISANQAARYQGINELPGQVNYFIGSDPKKWRTNIPTYARVEYNNVYPGVDLVY